MSALDPAALKRIDAFPFLHKVSDLMRGPVMRVAGDAPLREAIHSLRQHNISAILVDDPGGLGIMTERDVVAAVDRLGGEALEQPCLNFSTRPLTTVRADALLHVALGRMDRLNRRHIVVVDDTDRPVGMLSVRAVLRQRTGEGLALGDAVAEAADAGALKEINGRLPGLVRGLLAEGITGLDVAAILSAVAREQTARCAEIAEKAMEQSGKGRPPASYAVLVLGSAGRGESLLARDQDNALVHGSGEGAEAWFTNFGERLATLLNDAGIPFCKGGVMTSNPAWRGTPSAWHERVRGWTTANRGEDILAADIFFDAVPVHGDRSLAEQVLKDARTQVQHAIPFLKLLAQSIEQFRPPLTWLGRLRTVRDGGAEPRLDLKLGGLLPLVSGIRALALRYGIGTPSTAERIAGLRAAHRVNEADSTALLEALRVMSGCVLRQQLVDLSGHREPCNRIDPAILKEPQHAALKSALQAVAGLPATVKSGMV